MEIARSQDWKLKAICRVLQNNQHRMRYDEYLAAGYPIASGVIEGACRHFVKDRMERTGLSRTKKVHRRCWTCEASRLMAIGMGSPNIASNVKQNAYAPTLR